MVVVQFIIHCSTVCEILWGSANNQRSVLQEFRQDASSYQFNNFFFSSGILDFQQPVVRNCARHVLSSKQQMKTMHHVAVRFMYSITYGI